MLRRHTIDIDKIIKVAANDPIGALGMTQKTQFDQFADRPDFGQAKDLRMGAPVRSAAYTAIAIHRFQMAIENGQLHAIDFHVNHQAIAPQNTIAALNAMFLERSPVERRVAQKFIRNRCI